MSFDWYDEPRCTCGHRWVYHGDRVLGACDGGYAGLEGVRFATHGRGMCECTGWVRDEGFPWAAHLPTTLVSPTG